jgi:hypothetical protein
LGRPYLHVAQLPELQPAHFEPPTGALSPLRLDERAANRDIRRCTRLPLQPGQRIPAPLLPMRQSSSKTRPQWRHLNS